MTAVQLRTIQVLGLQANNALDRSIGRLPAYRPMQWTFDSLIEFPPSPPCRFQDRGYSKVFVQLTRGTFGLGNQQLLRKNAGNANCGWSISQGVLM